MKKQYLTFVGLLVVLTALTLVPLVVFRAAGAGWGLDDRLTAAVIVASAGTLSFLLAQINWRRVRSFLPKSAL
jgi:hypothetical protein